MKKTIFILGLTVLIIIGLTGCNPGTELGEETAAENKPGEGMNPNPSGKLNISIASDPGGTLSGIMSAKNENVINLFVTIKSLEVHKTSDPEAGWHLLPVEESAIDLMALDSGSWAALISSSEITPGSYNLIRFAVTEAEVTTESGTYTAKVPSGKIKINLTFTVSEDRTTTITMTIDPRKSLVIAGNEKNPKYILTPVFKISGITEEEDEDGDD